MPGTGDGLEVLTKLRSDSAPPIPPVILLRVRLDEQEALRRGALMFLRKPVAPADLCEFVALGLHGERAGAETAARERANSTTARMRARQSAGTLVANIRRDVEQRTGGQMAWWLAAVLWSRDGGGGSDGGRSPAVFAAAGDPPSRPE